MPRYVSKTRAFVNGNIIDQVPGKGAPGSSGATGPPGSGAALYVQAADPGAVGPNSFWAKTGGVENALYVRNPTNSAWLLIFSPPQWTVGTNGDVTARSDDITKTPITIQALVGQLVALLNLKDENGATAAITGGLTPWGDTGLVVSDPTASTPFAKGWISLGMNPTQTAAGIQEIDLVLSYGDGSENVTEIWCGPPGGQSGFNIAVKKPTDHGERVEMTCSNDPSTGNSYLEMSRNGGSRGDAEVGVHNGVAHLKVMAAPVQTAPLLDIRDSANNSLLRTTQPVTAQNAVVAVTASDHGNINADAGNYTISVTSQFGDIGNAIVTVGDSAVTIQSAFDAIAVGEFFVTGGDWSNFAVEFIGNNANTDEGDPFVIIANTMTLGGNPVADPIAFTTVIGAPNNVAGVTVISAQVLPDVADLAVGDHGSISDPAEPSITRFLKDGAGALRTEEISLGVPDYTQSFLLAGV